MTLPEEREAQEGASVILWPDREHGPWGIQAMWENIDGRPEAVGLSIWRGAWQGHSSSMAYFPIPGATLRPITATGIAELPIASIVDELRKAALEHWRRSSSSLRSRLEERGENLEDWSEILAPSSFETVAPKMGTPAKYPDGHYVRVAEIYLDAWDQGNNPTQAVMEAFDASRSAASKWIAKARGDRLQLLTPATHGKAGAQPGPRLLELWAARHNGGRP